MTLVIDGQTNATYRDKDVTDATGHGVHIIRSTGTLLYRLTVHDCAMSGIRDFASDTAIVDCEIDGNGRTGTGHGGDGILVQGQRARVTACRIDMNGNDTTLEHGIYCASPARGYHITDNTLAGNSASGIKADGGGYISDNRVSGSVRGLVLEGKAQTPVVLRHNIVSAKTYAVILTSTSDLARFDCDENTYAPGSRFMMAGKGSGDLAWWQKTTGLDKHSVYA